MCGYANQCELYDAEFCGTVKEPNREWPCFGSDGLRGQIQPTEDYKELSKNNLNTLLDKIRPAGMRLVYADGDTVQLVNELDIVCYSRNFPDCNDDKAVCDWVKLSVGSGK